MGKQAKLASDLRAGKEVEPLDLPVWSEREPRWLLLLAPILIACVTFAIYSGNERNGFHFDDLETLRTNPSLTKLRTVYELNTREGDSPLRRFQQFRNAIPETLEALYAYNKFRIVTYGTFTLNDFFAGGTRGDPIEGDPFTVRPKASLHQTNNAIHALNGVLVFWLVYLSLTAPAFRRSRTAVQYPAMVALLAGLIFALHPMQTQAVTYLSQRGESLCATFYLLTLCLVGTARVRSLGEPRGTHPWITPCLLGGVGILAAAAFLGVKLGGGSLWIAVKLSAVLGLLAIVGLIGLVKTGRDEPLHALLMTGGFLAFALGLQTKEVAATIPLAILLWDLVFVPGDDEKAAGRLWLVNSAKRGGLERWRYHAPWVLAVVAPLALLAWGGVVARSQVLSAEVTEGGRTIGLSAKDYALAQGNVLHTYLRTYLLPTNLHLDYDYPRPFVGVGGTVTTLLSFAGLIAAVVLAFLWGKRARVVAFGLLFGLLILAPSSSIVVLPDMIYEHRFYLPLAGAALVSAVVIERLVRRFASPQQRLPILASVGVALAIVLGVSTVARNEVWDSDLVLWTDNVEKAPNKPRPLTNLALAYQNREESLITLRSGLMLYGQLAEVPGGGLYLYRQTSFLSKPPQPLSKGEISKVEPQRGGLESAREYYRQALKADPNYNKAQNNLALISVYERHNLVQENQWITLQFIPELAKRGLHQVGPALKARLQNNRVRIQHLFEVARDIFYAQDKAGISNYFLYNNFANLFFQHALYLAGQNRLIESQQLMNDACKWMERARGGVPPAEVWVLSGEMHKFRADVTYMAVEAKLLDADDSPAESARADWNEALRLYGEYMRRSPDRKHLKRVRAAVLETSDFLSGKTSPSSRAVKDEMQKRIKQAKGEAPPDPKKHDH